jgi:hypothetical protein
MEEQAVVIGTLIADLDPHRLVAVSAGGCAPLPARIRQVRASASVEGLYDTGSSRTPLRSAHRAHAIWRC